MLSLSLFFSSAYAILLPLAGHETYNGGSGEAKHIDLRASQLHMSVVTAQDVLRKRDAWQARLARH